MYENVDIITDIIINTGFLLIFVIICYWRLDTYKSRFYLIVDFIL